MHNKRNCLHFSIFRSKQKNNGAILAYLKKLVKFFEGAAWFTLQVVFSPGRITPHNADTGGTLALTEEVS